MKDTTLEILLEAKRILKEAPLRLLTHKSSGGQPGPRQKPVPVPSDSNVVRLNILNILLGKFYGDEYPSLLRVRHEYILAVIESCDGSISEAARRLGTDRRILHRMINKRIGK